MLMCVEIYICYTMILWQFASFAGFDLGAVLRERTLRLGLLLAGESPGTAVIRLTATITFMVPTTP